MKILKFAIILLSVIVSGCKPDYVKIDIYTSDFNDAIANQIVQVPVEMRFSGHFGEDQEDEIKQVIQLSKKFLGESAEYTRSKGQFGDEVIVIKVQVPMGTEDNLRKHQEKIAAPLQLRVNTKNNSVILVTDESLNQFNKQMLSINFMLQIEMIPSTLTYNIVSDEKTVYQISGNSVFVNEKPHLEFQKLLKRRESIALDYSGEIGSIWKSEALRPWVRITPASK